MTKDRGFDSCVDAENDRRLKVKHIALHDVRVDVRLDVRFA